MAGQNCPQIVLPHRIFKIYIYISQSPGFEPEALVILAR